MKKWQGRVSDLFNQIIAGKGWLPRFLFEQFPPALAAVSAINVVLGVMHESQQHLAAGGAGLIMFLLVAWIWLRMHSGD